MKFTLKAQRRRELEALGIVADEEAANDEFARVVLADHGLYVDDRQILGEVIAGVVQHAAHGRVGAAHHAFHTVDGAEEVAAVNADGATGADEDVLVVVRHANDFMRNDLSDRKNQVVATVAEELVDLGRPGEVEFAFADFVDEAAGDFAEGDDVVAPVVDAEERAWGGSVHGRYLFVCHGLVSAEGGEDIGEAVAVVLPG